MSPIRPASEDATARGILRLAPLLIVLPLMAIASSTYLGELEAASGRTPAVAGHGEVEPIPGAALAPKRGVRYRQVYDLTSSAKSSSKVNPALDKLARAANLFGAAGVDPRAIDLVGVVHSDATRAILSDDAYRARFKTANPNTALLAALKKEGIELYVCGQALAHAGYARDEVSDDVEVAQSAITAVAELQRRGYHLQAF